LHYLRVEVELIANTVFMSFWGAANIPPMRRRLLWLVPLCLLVSLADAETPLPTTTYRLHAQKEEHSANLPSTLLYLLPDQALLVLIPQRDGKWVLKRLTSWDTVSPKEETLTFAGDPPHEGRSGFEDLKVDPSSTFAVIRIRSFTGSMYPIGANRSALIVLVNLRSFTIVSQRATTDPLLAASDWSFIKDGLLIASAHTERSTVPPQLKHGWEYKSITDTYEAAAFTLPDWKASMDCQYQRVLDFPNGSNTSTWHLGKVDDACAALVKVARVPTAEALPGGEFPSVRYANLARPCLLASESPSGNFALYGCRTGGGYFDDMIMTTKSRSLTVLSVPEGKTVLTIPLPHNMQPVPALLANASGHIWLLILRDGIEMEIYKLP
jgi:hypothetical protein